jgi:hypothetical protein
LTGKVTTGVFRNRDKFIASEAAQHSVQWTLGILVRFQAVFYASAFSVWTAFRRPPQRH